MVPREEFKSFVGRRLPYCFSPATHRNRGSLPGVAGYKVLEVVSGRADAYLHSSLIKKWDVCAGDALLRALGGRLSALDGSDLQYGPQDDPKAKGGLLATLHGHAAHLGALRRQRDA